jgi:molybdopterin converting factor small subunit
MTEAQVATVEMPFEALVKELGAKRAIKFLSKIRRKYGDSVVELRRATEKMTIEQVEKEVERLKKKAKCKKLYENKTHVLTNIMLSSHRFIEFYR